MEIPNPNQNKEFDGYYDKVGPEGKPVHAYGYRMVDGAEEIVNLQNGQSNMKYWKPEKVLDPEGCEHEFVITNIGKREVECHKCHMETSFIPGINFKESKSGASITLNKKTYQIIYL